MRIHPAATRWQMLKLGVQVLAYTIGLGIMLWLLYSEVTG